MNPVLRFVGPTLAWLRERHILALVAFAGTITALVASLLLPDASWYPLRIIAGVAGAAAVIADRFADSYEKKVSAITFVESERSAEKSIEHLNVFLSEAIEITFLQGEAREEATKALRRQITQFAARSIGDGTRASFYPMRREGGGGKRVLGPPFHTTEFGRYDKPTRPFEERVDPDHEIWGLLDRDDEEPEVRSYPEEVYGLDWSKKKYRTFYSVPVKANTVQLGFLSVNNSKVGAIGGPQRATLLAMARTLALMLAMEKGPQSMKTQAAFHEVSGVAVTVGNNNEEVADG